MHTLSRIALRIAVKPVKKQHNRRTSDVCDTAQAIVFFELHFPADIAYWFVPENEWKKTFYRFARLE